MSIDLHSEKLCFPVEFVDTYSIHSFPPPSRRTQQNQPFPQSGAGVCLSFNSTGLLPSRFRLTCSNNSSTMFFHATPLSSANSRRVFNPGTCLMNSVWPLLRQTYSRPCKRRGRAGCRSATSNSTRARAPPSCAKYRLSFRPSNSPPVSRPSSSAPAQASHTPSTLPSRLSPTATPPPARMRRNWWTPFDTPEETP